MKDLGKEPPATSEGSGSTLKHRILSPRQIWMIFLLCLLYGFSTIDRIIPSIIIRPIKEVFSLTDIHIGVLLGAAFGVVYAFMGLPAARLVDRGVRTNLLFIGVTIWCLATIGSAFATSFWFLLAMRLGLAAGESILVPAAHSLIGDLEDPSARSLAASIFQAAGSLGTPIAFFAGGILLEMAEGPNDLLGGVGLDGWQVVLIMVGAPGLILGFIFILTVREPSRKSSGKEHFGADLPVLFRQMTSNARLYVGLLLAAALPAAAGYAFVYWSVELMERDLGWTTKQGGMAFGIIYLFGGIGGTLLAPWLSRKLKAIGRPDYGIIACLIFAVFGTLGFAFAPLQSNWLAMLLLLWLGVFGFNGTTQNIIVAMQEVAPLSMRGTFVATLYLVISLFGLGIGPTAAPAIAALISSGDDMLGLGLAICGGACMLCSLIPLIYVRGDFVRQAELGFPSVEFTMRQD